MDSSIESIETCSEKILRVTIFQDISVSQFQACLIRHGDDTCVILISGQKDMVTRYGSSVETVCGEN